MTKLEEAVIEAAKRLPLKLRQRLVNELQDSGEPDITREWIAEIERRANEVDAGRMKTIPGEKVMKNLRAKLEHHRSSKSNGRRRA